MILHFVNFAITLAITIPKSMNMKELDKLTPQDSIFNVFWNNVLHYRLLIAGIAFAVVSLFLMFVLLKFLFGTKAEEEQTKCEEDCIYLAGRKLFLPQSSILQGLEKYYLSEDFSDAHLKNESNAIYKETLIAKLGLPTE